MGGRGNIIAGFAGFWWIRFGYRRRIVRRGLAGNMWKTLNGVYGTLTRLWRGYIDPAASSESLIIGSGISNIYLIHTYMDIDI